MKRIFLHLTALVVLLPCLLLFNVSEHLWVNFIGAVYIGYLAVLTNESETAKKFVCRYYHEILRLENMM